MNDLLAPSTSSTQSAAVLGSKEDPCTSATHGRSGTLAAKRDRQAYANSVVAEWQRAHPTLDFPALLAFFRLAGKEFDRNDGRV